MAIGLLTLHIRISSSHSLKEKRRAIKPLLSRLQKEFNVSVAELDHLDSWQEAVIGCCWISNDSKHIQRSLQKVIRWVERHFPHLYIIKDHVELI